jgi:histone demethylase
LGVNVPQVYLKTAGVWTGGHQENSSVSSINFNHGPDPCIWYTIDAEHVSKLLLIVPDLFKKEGLWFKNLNFFLENKIPIRRTV